MDNQEKLEYLRQMQEGLRALSPKELLDLQIKHTPGMQNSQYPYGDDAANNTYGIYGSDQFQPPPTVLKLTLFHRFLKWVLNN